MTERCDDCLRDFVDPPGWRRVRQCPRCVAIEDDAHRLAGASVVELPPWRWSRVAMQEKLGVTGREDV